LLAELVERLAAIGHLRRLRVHTRLPVVIPQRVTEELIGWLRGTRLTSVVVVHVNHPQEIDTPTAAAFRTLAAAGVPLLNQAVLLAGINDRVQTLAELSCRLIEAGVLPYYLHQLDRVAGAAHFEVPPARGRRLIAELRRKLPGYLVPRYVRELPGAPAKVLLA
jgi:KamA family protein